MMWFTAVGREAGQNPYYTHYYRVKLDGTQLVSLTPDDGNHAAIFSPSGKYLVDTWSKTDVPPASAVRDAVTGALIMPLEKGPILRRSRRPAGIRSRPIKMKARDGTTDIYGVMYKPADFDPAKKYPIINQIYPGPQSGSNGAWGWTAAGGEAQRTRQSRLHRRQDQRHGHAGSRQEIPRRVLRARWATTPCPIRSRG